MNNTVDTVLEFLSRCRDYATGWTTCVQLPAGAMEEYYSLRYRVQIGLEPLTIQHYTTELFRLLIKTYSR
jgi:hypothetical protein